jgi:hypothetical protein
MSFNGNFTAIQSTDNSGFTLTDTSTGADTNLTDRQVLIYQVNGNLLTGTAIDWPIANGALVLTGILPIDYALSILVNWISSSPLPSPSTYTKTLVTGFTGNTQNFILGLLQQIAAKQGTTNDQGFLYNLGVIQTYVDNVAQCIANSDQGNAQVSLSLAQGMINNQSLFF